MLICWARMQSKQKLNHNNVSSKQRFGAKIQKVCVYRRLMNRWKPFSFSNLFNHPVVLSWWFYYVYMWKPCISNCASPYACNAIQCKWVLMFVWVEVVCYLQFFLQRSFLLYLLLCCFFQLHLIMDKLSLNSHITSFNSIWSI